MHLKTLFTSLVSAAFIGSTAIPAAGEDVVRIAVLPYLSQGIISIGIAEGYFKAEGIIVERIELRRSVSILPGLTSGDIDVALDVPSAGYFNAITRGGQARIVAPGVTFDPMQCDYAVIYGAKGFNRTAVAGTDGQDIRISATADSFPEYAVRLLNDLPDVGKHNITVNFVRPNSLADALTNKALDMALTAEPWITRLDASGAGQVVVGMSELLPNAEFTHLVFSGRLLEEDPELGRRVKRAMDAAILQYNEGKTPRNVEIIAEFTGLDTAIVEQACWAHVPVDGAVNTAALMGFQTWLMEKNLIDKMLPENSLIAPLAAQ